MNQKVGVLLILVMTLSLVSGGIVYAISPYDSGYNHGCSDARLGGHSYLNQNPTHTQVFMNGYNTGYSACGTTSQEDWSGVCSTIEWGLMNTCSTYVLPGGELTQEGIRAKNCISGGAFLSGASYLLTSGLIPTDLIIKGLEVLAPGNGCGGVVNFDALRSNVGNALGLLQVLGVG